MEIDKKDLRCGLRQMRKAVGPCYMAYMANMRWNRINRLLACKKCCLRFWENFDWNSKMRDADRSRISNVRNLSGAVYTDAQHVAFIFADTPEGSSYWHTVSKEIKKMEEGET